MKAGRGWLIWAALAYAVVIASVAFGLTTLYTQSRDRLDEAMGERLLASALGLAGMSDGRLITRASYGDLQAVDYLEELRVDFEGVRQATDLSEITLTDCLDDRVIFSTSPGLVPDESNLYWSLEPAAAEQAKLGSAVATPLYALDGLYQKSAHAPVFVYDADGMHPVAVVTVSGDPDFFNSLARLRRASLATGGAVLAVLVVMGVFIWRIHLSLAKSRMAVLRQENLATMGRMTAGIAHEIRNPLGIIRGAGQHLVSLLDREGLDTEVADFIPVEVDRLDKILTGYLTFGRGGGTEPEVFHLGDAVQRSVAVLENEFAEAGVTCQVVACRADTPVLGDPTRFSQVMLNLLLNARDAMPEGGPVIVEMTAAGNRVLVRIKDSGTGLDQAVRGHAFEPFWTNKEKGGGLGLALARGIVEEMDGTLDLDNRSDGPGACAVIDLPLELA